MDFHVGSLANLIRNKTHGDTSGTKLFDEVPSDVGSDVRFKVIPAAKRKRITETDIVDENETSEVNEVEDAAEPRYKKSKQNNAVNAAKRLQNPKLKEKERIANPDEDRRTIFIGNLPCNIKLIKLKKLFKQYGEVESARLRCPPIKDTKLPKRVAAIKKAFHPERTNIVGFIRFASEEEAHEAVKANGMLYKDHHLRVDLATRSRAHDQKRAVFVGNLHFGIEENDVWNFFEQCGPVDSVRIVRDSATGVGKGFAYVNFKDLSSVELALKLDDHELKDRQIRVTRAVKKVKLKKGDPRYKKKSQGMRKRNAGQQWKGSGKSLEGGWGRKGAFLQKEEEGLTEEGRAFPRGGGGGSNEEKRPFPRGGGGSGGSTEGRKSSQKDGEPVRKTKEGHEEKVPGKKLKVKSDKGSPKVKKTSSEGPSFLGNKIDDEVEGKAKKKKLSKSELKKKVLAFQLQLKKSGITNP